MLARLILASTLVASSAGAALPRLHDDQAVSPIIYGPSKGGGFVRSATDGLNFLIVAYSSDRVYATRISRTGDHLDSPSVVIARDTGVTNWNGVADVVYVGGQYVIAYSTKSSIATIRLSQDGRLLDFAPRIVSSTTALKLRLAWNGRNLLLLMDGARIRLLDRDGAPAASEQTLTPKLVYSDVASNGDGFLITGSAEQTWGIPVDRDGRIGGRFLLSDIGLETAVASNGSDYLVVGASTSGTVRIVVHRDGSQSAAKSLNIAFGWNPLAVWTGSEYVVAFTTVQFSPSSTQYETVVQGLDARGTWQYGSTFTNENSLLYSLQSNGSECLLLGIFLDEVHGFETGYLFQPRLQTTEKSAKAIGTINRVRGQSAAAIAGNGSSALLVWREDTDVLTGGAVYGVLIDAGGMLGQAFQIAADSYNDSQPAVASNGHDFLVLWESQSKSVLARRVTPEGTLLDAKPIFVGYAQYDTGIAAAWSGRTYIAVWTDIWDLYTATVSAAGVSHPPFPQATAIATYPWTEHPAIACGSGGCAALCISDPRFYGPPGVTTDTVSARLTTDGAVVGQQEVPEDPYGSVLMARGNDITLFYAGGAESYYDSVVRVASATNNWRRTFLELSDTYPVAVVDDGIYLVTAPRDQRPMLRWTRTSDSFPVGQTIDIDSIYPSALAVTSRALCVVNWIYDVNTASGHLYVRTFPRPDLPTPDLIPPTPHRRVVH